MNKISYDQCTKIYRIAFDECGITHDIIAASIGYPVGDVPSPVTNAIDTALLYVKSNDEIHAGYRIFYSCMIDISKGFIAVDNVTFRTGQTIASQMQGATQCLLFTCTSGTSLERYSQQIKSSGDFLYSFVIDSISALIVEKAMDIVQSDIASSFASEGVTVTNRYSPGYCGWPLEEQHLLFSLLPHAFCGVALTQSALMIPMKSISGIIGAGTCASFRKYGCELCSLEHCTMRKPVL